MGGGEASRGAASLRGMASRRAAGGSFFRAATMGSADPQGPLCLPDGLAVVIRSSRGAQAVRGDPGADGKAMRRSATAAFRAFAGVKDFSRVACLAFPSESADAFCRVRFCLLALMRGASSMLLGVSLLCCRPVIQLVRVLHLKEHTCQ